MVLETEQYNQMLNDIYFITDSGVILSNKYRLSTAYISQIKNKLNQLKYPPKIVDDKIVCYKCGKKPKNKLVFHHIHKTGEMIALICHKCNLRVGDNELEYLPHPIIPDTKHILIDDDIHTLIKTTASKEKKSIKSFLEDLVKEYLKEDNHVKDNSNKEPNKLSIIIPEKSFIFRDKKYSQVKLTDIFKSLYKLNKIIKMAERTVENNTKSELHGILKAIIKHGKLIYENIF